MPDAPESYDFFVSYARADNTTGWITRFIEALQKEQRRFTGGREFRVFFDTSDIRSLDDWRHRIQESLADSRLLVAFISPNYFAGEWCRREWRTWIDARSMKSSARISATNSARSSGLSPCGQIRTCCSVIQCAGLAALIVAHSFDESIASKYCL